ncbi:MAG: tetratricopeptide repeat protein [Betaproteobacteria bacterium]
MNRCIVAVAAKDLRARGQWAVATAAVLGTFLLPCAAQERFRPADASVMLAASVHAQGTRAGSLRALEQAWRADPQRMDAALPFARAAFTLGLVGGDLRWFGSAKAALMPWWQAKDLPAEALFLRGLVQQGFHDFDAGLQDITAAIAREPQRAEFWSWRFALHLLQANMEAARQDCAEIERLFGRSEAEVYRAVLLYRTGQPQPAIAVLKLKIAAADFQTPASQQWLGFHLGEALRVAGQPDKAAALWEKLLKAHPPSHTLRLALAELLNAQGRFAQAKAALGSPPMTDALLMQALLASRGLKDGQEQRLDMMLQERYAAQALRQEALIERPRLIYLISGGKDLATGLALSIDNWKLQKEPPDAVLFVQAALALDQPRAAEPVLAWAKATGYTEPALAQLLQQMQAHPRWMGGKP